MRQIDLRKRQRALSRCACTHVFNRMRWISNCFSGSEAVELPPMVLTLLAGISVLFNYYEEQGNVGIEAKPDGVASFSVA